MADIKRNAMGSDFISSIQHGHNDIIFHPQTTEAAHTCLLQTRESWTKHESTSVLTSGVYDGLNPDHAAYLLHVKTAGAEPLYNARHSNDWYDLRPHEQEEYVRYALSHAALLRLILSIDGDKSVAIRKKSKGGSARPLYGWNSRATMVANLSYRSPDDPSVRLPVVDAITTHGPEDFPADHPHHSIEQLAIALQPDIWGVYDESTDIFESISNDTQLSKIPVRTVSDATDSQYWKDDIHGKVSTTAIVKRILGDRAA